ncbi:Transposase [Bacillus sp. GeD10]|nr:Transposase [Bacillus sp. GeD10]
MSRKGSCYDKAVIEIFFGIMNSEFLYIKEFDIYVDYYNTKQIKEKFKMSTLP